MTEVKIKFPGSRCYLNVHIFETNEEMINYLGEVGATIDAPFSKDEYIGAVCTRYFEKYKIADLLFSKDDLEVFFLQHELQHVVVNYSRYRFYRDKNYNPYETKYEEEIAYLYPYLLAELECLCGFGSAIKRDFCKKTYLYNKKRYQWGERKKKKKNGRKISA
jgi:hypothetical protein